MQLTFKQQKKTQTSNFTSRINSFEQKGDQIYYTILIISNIDGSVQVSHKRYSDFKNAHQRLLTLIGLFQLDVNIPKLPGRKLFGHTNSSYMCVQTRMAELNTYCQDLLQNDLIYDFPLIKEMLPKIQEQNDVLLSLIPNDFLDYSSQVQDQYCKEKCWEQMDELKQQFLNKQDRKEIHLQNDQIITSRDIKSKTISFLKDQQYLFDVQNYEIITEQGNQCVYYTVIIRDTQKHDRWKYKGRYSNFYNLHVALSSMNNILVLPEFPKKKIFTITNDNPQLLDARKLQLDQYLNNIYSIPTVVNSDIGVYFIQSSKRKCKKEQKLIIPSQKKKENTYSNIQYTSPSRLSSVKENFEEDLI